MKKIVLTLTLAALSLPTIVAAEVPMSESCPQIAEVARVTMLARQAGVPLRSMMGIVKNPITVDIITEAYSAPAYSTQEYQERAIQEFENLWYLKCVKAYNQ